MSSNNEGKSFKQPSKPVLAKKTQEKENLDVPAAPKNDPVESMDISNVVQAAPQKEEIQIEDIDIEDAGNPQLVVEYVQDIYNYLRYVKYFNSNNHQP